VGRKSMVYQSPAVLQGLENKIKVKELIMVLRELFLCFCDFF
jgi:hypothetical protein